MHAHARLELEAELRGEGDDFFLQIEKQLERDVKEVAAAAGGIEHGEGGEFVVESGERFALGSGAFASHEGGGEIALELAPLAAQRRPSTRARRWS